MPKFKSPGVYIEEVSSRLRTVNPVETAIPAFIGHTKITKNSDNSSLLFEAVKISSFLEFENIFGGPFHEELTIDIRDTFDPTGKLLDRQFKVDFSSGSSDYFLYHSLKLYFDNGGGACYVVSIGNYKDETAVGNAKSGFLGGLEAIKKESEPTILVFPEAVNLSLADYSTVVTAALNQCAALDNRFTILDFKGDILDEIVVKDFRSALIGTHLSYGAAYGPNLKTVYQHVYEPGSITIKHLQENGLSGSPLPCEVEDFSGAATTLQEKNPLVYREIENAIKKLQLELPPSAAIAGIYASVDNDRGVWKAPANVSINSVVDVTSEISHNQQENLNLDLLTGISINAIRRFVGKGILVWGARTMTGNDIEYRYINVRRFLLFVQESASRFLKQFAFEPNDDNTWTTVKAGLSNFLIQLYRNGALAGATVDDAFFVNIGLGVTMTQTDIDDGNMIVEIGMAVVRPAEFTIIRILQRME